MTRTAKCRSTLHVLLPDKATAGVGNRRSATFTAISTLRATRPAASSSSIWVQHRELPIEPVELVGRPRRGNAVCPKPRYEPRSPDAGSVSACRKTRRSTPWVPTGDGSRTEADDRPRLNSRLIHLRSQKFGLLQFSVVTSGSAFPGCCRTSLRGP
jgi:hypothetical protein